jgi:hypothetical protein
MRRRAFIAALGDVESKRVDEFANMSDEELRQRTRLERWDRVARYGWRRLA